MKWLSKEDERNSWRMFWESFWYPAYIWCMCILVMYGISYIIVTFPENPNRNNILEETWKKFNEIILFIPSGVNFQISIITMFGTLILTLFVNSRNENTWSSPEEYTRKSAYRKYVCTITHVLGFVWFSSFLCKIFNVGIDSDVPAWLFLFLSWFILSIIKHMKSLDFSAHTQIMSLYRDVAKIEGNDKKTRKVYDYIYKLHVQGKKNFQWYEYVLKNIILAKKKKGRLISPVDYNLYSSDKDKFIMHPIKMGIVFSIYNIIFQFIIFSAIFWCLGFVYEIRISLNFSSIVIWVGVGCYGVIFSAYYFFVLHNSIIDLQISYKVYSDPKEFKKIFKIISNSWHCIILLLYMSILILIAIMKSLDIDVKDNYKNFPFGNVLTIGFIIIGLVVFLEIFLLLKEMDKIITDINNNMMDIVKCCIEKFNNDLKRNKKSKRNEELGIDGSDLNIFKITMSVYLRLESRKSYMEYLRSSGKNTKNLEKDLKKAYKLAKESVE